MDILYCPSLTNLSGLENIESCPTRILIWGNSSLTNLEGLNDIQSVSTTLKLQNNSMLNDISALANVDFSALSYLTIKDNLELSICNINSICDVLDNGIAEFTIENNGNGCNSVSEIENACATSIEELKSDLLGFYPNPAKTEITFNQHRIKNIKIFNQIGQPAYSQKGVTKTMEISILETGVYFLNIEYSNIIYTEKLVVERN